MATLSLADLAASDPDCIIFAPCGGLSVCVAALLHQFCEWYRVLQCQCRLYVRSEATLKLDTHGYVQGLT